MESYHYEEINSKLKNISPALHDTLVNKCQENAWLKRGGIPFQDDLYLEQDSPYSFVEAEDMETLQSFFWQGNWSIRQGVVYGDLAFINQVNGGDEWWTLKFDRDTDRWVDFESITFRNIIEQGEFPEFIARFAIIKQCEHLDC